MVQINRLRLSGFKSFVDKTELDIGQGLNGIVGPNGCGKSNLVEALRWVMGENRAKHMRGGDMEDVIFAGTSARPARSIAEVSVLLDNTDGTAPHPFTGSTQIEVTRRIEKDKGSQYLVNGKAVRARDVQMLFADSMTGAHSPALVSQGRVTQLIQAKPGERRQMLEESAGVASLYTRRHEAELRLKAAEENISKLDLVINELGSRANALRSQAKQATRYRELSENIRRLESLIAWQDWGSTRDKLKKEEQRFGETDALVRDALLKASELTVLATEAAEKVDSVRHEDAEARAALQLLRQAAEQLEREAGHRRHEHSDLVRQIAQAKDDLTLATEQQNALRERAAIIAADLAKITGDDAENPEGLEALEQEFAAAQTSVRGFENDVLAHQGRIRETKGELESARSAQARAETEARRAADRLATLEAQYAEALKVGSEEEELAATLASLETLKGERAQAEETLAAAQSAFDAARESLSAARDAQAALAQEKNQKTREIKSLNDLLARLSQGYEGSHILSLDIPAELAVAIASAAGDAALKATSGNWAAGAEGFAGTDWAEGATPLATLIQVPAELAAFVSSVGVVADADTGARLAPTLKRGQTLVSREGALWRWDGLAIRHSATATETPESQILSLRAQIRDTEAALAKILPALEAAETTLATQTGQRETLNREVLVAQSVLRDTTSRLQTAERRAESLQKVVNDRVVKRSLLSGQRDQAADAAKTADEALNAATQAFTALETAGTAEALAQALAAAETGLAGARTQRDTLSGQIEALKAAAQQAKQLRHSLENEAGRTADQIAKIESHTKGLSARIEALTERRTTLDPQVAEDEAGTARNALLERIVAAEESAAKASDAFAEAEARAKTLAGELKKVENDGVTVRERRAVIQATVQALQGEIERIALDIEERFSCSPSVLENAVMADWAESIPSQSRARAERDSLNRDRDELGPVNLRAEVELGETETEQTRLDAEKIDLTAAIERLREGIGTLNGEARERIVKTFEAVNTHFQSLFKRLFGGGEAYLKLIDSEDPLDAGLEIFAQPPGKSLQSLSLLSGGEQTLTALALIFAMFLSNPSPVCVLDEVDAPLDDANVDRVCTMLEEMSTKCATRFLVISHHRMTMARMDRLYGVTMAERGISQLVSVNLAMQGDLLAHTHGSKAA